jgi:hypothetical protein
VSAYLDEHEEFRFDRLNQEALDLPASYSTMNGDVLVTVVDGFSIGCIAYRRSAEPLERDCCDHP